MKMKQNWIFPNILKGIEKLTKFCLKVWLFFISFLLDNLNSVLFLQMYDC